MLIFYYVFIYYLFRAPKLEYLKNRNLHTFLYFFIIESTSYENALSSSFARFTNFMLGTPYILDGSSYFAVFHS